MANAAKYQVFISSTYEDLKDERDQVIRAVLEMGHIPVGMEMFSAADDEQWKIIARHIEESDYYAVVVAHRLGSLADGGISYTRKEYEYAMSMGIPVLGFIIEDKASWPADRIDTSTGTKRALEEFKSLIRGKPVSFWTSAEDLYGRFSVALMKAMTANPREGWIRASQIVNGPEVTAEVVRLSSENANLRKQLRDAEVASDREQLEELDRVLNTLANTKRNPSYRYTSNGEWHRDAEITLFRVFLLLAPDMIVEASVDDMAKDLAMEIRLDREQRWDLVAINQFKGLLADLMTLDLVQPSTRKHPLSNTSVYWSLTALGQEMLKLIRKTTLSETTDSQSLPEESPLGDGEPQESSGDPQDSVIADAPEKTDAPG